MLSRGVKLREIRKIFAGGDPVQCPSCHHRWRELLLCVLHAGDHHSLHGFSAEAQCLQGLLAAWLEGGFNAACFPSGVGSWKPEEN